MTILKLSLAALAALMVGAWAEGAKATSGISNAATPIAIQQ
jgi:hypothetical protein